MERRRGTDHHSFRLPTTPPKPVRECWRCAEDRRVLTEVRLVRATDGATFGVALVCGFCLSGVPLDPDPLDVTEAA